MHLSIKLKPIDVVYFLCTFYSLISLICGASRRRVEPGRSLHIKTLSNEELTGNDRNNLQRAFLPQQEGIIFPQSFFEGAPIRSKRFDSPNSEQPSHQSYLDYFPFYHTMLHFPDSEWSPCHNKDCDQMRCLKCFVKWYPVLNHVEYLGRCEPWNFNCPFMEQRDCEDQSTCARIQASGGNLCGLKVKPPPPPSVLLKILGGRRSVPHNWPWQVVLTSQSDKYLCGAVLIHSRWVLTAAHCVNPRVKNFNSHGIQDMTEAQIFAKLGDHYRHTRDIPEESIRVTHYLSHHLFSEDGPYTKYDIVLLKLQKPADIGPHVYPICLPPQGTVLPEDTQCWVSGWGQTTSSDNQGAVTLPDELQEVKLKLNDHESCVREMPVETDISDLFCTKKENKDTCQGDSGGGMYCLIPGTDRYQVYGITSFGVGVACHNSTGYYVNVASVSDWISHQMSTHLYD